MCLKTGHMRAARQEAVTPKETTSADRDRTGRPVLTCTCKPHTLMLKEVCSWYCVGLIECSQCFTVAYFDDFVAIHR